VEGELSNHQHLVGHSISSHLSFCDVFILHHRFLSYGTKCVPEMFAPVNRNWTTTPFTEIPGLYLAGSDAFLPSVTGAMYGGCLCACAVLGKVGTLRLGHAILTHLAKRLRDENPKLSRVEAYVLAVRKFVE
jgi:all-trans-retinol 13,14-reductase